MFIEFFFLLLHYKNNLKTTKTIKQEDGGTGMDGYAM